MKGDFLMDKKVARFLLVYFLGWIGSVVINRTTLKPEGAKSRSWAYFFLMPLTLGIYPTVAAIWNLVYDPDAEKNIGYVKE
jgi:hypothetical protein